MNKIKLASRIIIGIVFMFSGFVKAVDPLGTAYKFGDYFDSFHIEFFSLLALPLAVILITTEFVVGLVILLGLRMKIFSWILLVLSSFFFILTLYIAIANPVSDCGCFGDFLVISNWETFIKNVVILGITLFIFLHRNRFKEIYKPFIEWVIVICIAFFIISISVYCINHLPILDFRAYNVGANIQSKMEIPEGAPYDEYETTVVYKKGDIIKEFELNDPEWQGEGWEWVETRQKLIKKGYEPPIHDFVITDTSNNDITYDILNDKRYTFLLISYHLDMNKSEFYQKANEYFLFSEQNENYHFYAITSDLRENMDELIEKGGIEYDFCTADNITLKTILRSNPGLVLLKSGNVIAKWHYNDFPDINEFNNNYYVYVINTKRIYSEKSRVFNIVLLLILGIVTGRYFINKYYSA